MGDASPLVLRNRSRCSCVLCHLHLFTASYLFACGYVSRSKERISLRRTNFDTYACDIGVTCLTDVIYEVFIELCLFLFTHSLAATLTQLNRSLAKQRGRLDRGTGNHLGTNLVSIVMFKIDTDFAQPALVHLKQELIPARKLSLALCFSAPGENTQIDMVQRDEIVPENQKDITPILVLRPVDVKIIVKELKALSFCLSQFLKIQTRVVGALAPANLEPRLERVVVVLIKLRR